MEDNLRIIYEFCIGIPILNSHDDFKHAILEITDEITKITEGLTYEYVYGTWKKENEIERNFTVRISIIVFPHCADHIYHLIKDLISVANKKYNLGILHIQAMKTFGYAQHFMV
jgi:hypothetical protein